MPNPTPQTPARDPRREPTCKESLQVHAARLREMAESIQAEVDSLRPLCDPSASFDSEEHDAAALFAGAAAIEAVEVAREALATQIKEHAEWLYRTGMKPEHTHLIAKINGAQVLTLHAALAQLEAL